MPPTPRAPSGRGILLLIASGGVALRAPPPATRLARLRRAEPPVPDLAEKRPPLLAGRRVGIRHSPHRQIERLPTANGPPFLAGRAGGNSIFVRSSDRRCRRHRSSDRRLPKARYFAFFFCGDMSPSTMWSSGVPMPRALRTLLSISLRRSGFSRRKSLAFSRPWPRRMSP